MINIEFNKREMMKMILYSALMSMMDAAGWIKRNAINFIIQVVAYCMIAFGFAAMVWGLFGGMR